MGRELKEILDSEDPELVARAKSKAIKFLAELEDECTKHPGEQQQNNDEDQI